MDRTPALRGRLLAGTAASAVLLGVYALGGAAHWLGWIALVPWLLALDQVRTTRMALVAGLLMALGFVASTFGWFAAAMDSYTAIGTPGAILVLCLIAPLLQPQLLAFALVRHLVGRRHGAVLRALAGTAAWVGCEWALPKVLGDTLGHALFPSTLFRQAADLGGAAGLTVLLLLVNEAIAAAITRRRDGLRALWMPLALALGLPAMLAAYGALRLASLQEMLAQPVPQIQVAMVQASIVDYERRRREVGSGAVVREVLDAHFDLSRAAIEHHGAEVLLWPETVYPTPFGQPRSEAGAAFDREVQAFVDASGVPLVFGTYEVDAAGEYNAAAFLEPATGLLGRYRKTHPFPLTEHVPAWLDGPLLRTVLPWTGSWRPGDGARVLPLRTADGRALQVVPLICLDDVRPALAIDGARLGAQAIVGLSNDAWFSDSPQGARLHLAVAAFRSIETRMPQLRATTNGLSAFIDPTGEVLAQTSMGDRAVLAGGVPVRDPPPTLMLRWGDWVGAAALVFLALLALLHVARATARSQGPEPPANDAPRAFDVALLTHRARGVVVALQVLAAGGLIFLMLRMLLRDGLQVNSLAQLWIYAGVVLAPLLVAASLRHALAATMRIEGPLLVLEQRDRRIEIPLANIARLRAWRVALPGPGVALTLASGRRLPHGIAVADPHAFAQSLQRAGSPARWTDERSDSRARFAAHHAGARWPRLDHPLMRFVAFPLLPALVAFRLHQHIAFGGTFGEWQTYGAGAWFAGLLIWWGAWSLGLMLFAAGLRIVIEGGAWTATWLAPTRAASARYLLEAGGRVAFYLGVPAVLAWRLL